MITTSFLSEKRNGIECGLIYESFYITQTRNTVILSYSPSQAIFHSTWKNTNMSDTVRGCVRCKEISKKTKKQCKRRTCLYSDYCWQHTRNTKGLKIKKSTIPNAGRGLFATRLLKRGEIIPYGGVRMTKKQVDTKYGGDDKVAEYVICHNKNRCFDASNTQSGLGRWVNDGVYAGRGKNAEFRTRRTGVFLELIQDVQPGEEILTTYGPEYWP